MTSLHYRSSGFCHLNLIYYPPHTQNFIAIGTSAVDASKDVIRGRPYGGTASLYHCNFAKSITVVDTAVCN